VLTSWQTWLQSFPQTLPHRWPTLWQSSWQRSPEHPRSHSSPPEQVQAWPAVHPPLFAVQSGRRKSTATASADAAAARERSVAGRRSARRARALSSGGDFLPLRMSRSIPFGAVGHVASSFRPLACRFARPKRLADRSRPARARGTHAGEESRRLYGRLSRPSTRTRKPAPRTAMIGHDEYPFLTTMLEPICRQRLMLAA
jgi:hypothetical protein